MYRLCFRLRLNKSMNYKGKMTSEDKRRKEHFPIYDNSNTRRVGRNNEFEHNGKGSLKVIYSF